MSIDIIYNKIQECKKFYKLLIDKYDIVSEVIVLNSDNTITIKSCLSIDVKNHINLYGNLLQN